MLRPVTQEDLPKIDRIWNEHHSDSFGLSNENLTIGSQVYELNSSLVAYGQLKVLAEALIVLDLDLSPRKRIMAITDLLNYCISGAKKAKLEQIHVFIKDPQYAGILQKSFQFELIKDIPLVLNLK